MNSRGFTLIELLSVIAILAIISLIAIPTVTNVINDSRDRAYDNQVNALLVGAKSWGAENMMELPDSDGEYIDVTLEELKTSGFVDSDIIDPRSNLKMHDTCTKVRIEKASNKLDYIVTVIDINGTC